MTVLDAFAVVGFLRGEPCAEQVEEVLRGATAISSADLAEVIDLLIRVFGFPEDEVLGDLALMRDAGLDIIDVDAAIATRAALVGAAAGAADGVGALGGAAVHGPVASGAGHDLRLRRLSRTHLSHPLRGQRLARAGATRSDALTRWQQAPSARQAHH